MLLCIGNSAAAQDFSNKGKDFWLGYGYHVRYVTTDNSNNINNQEMVLYFATENTANTTTNIKIEIPAVGYVENITNVAPGTIVTSAPLPKAGSQDARLTTEGLFNTGIHVTSSRPVVAYAHIYNGNVSGASLLFPTNTLGKDYYSINYTQVSNEDFSNSFFFVVAADTGTTTVEITPAAQTQTHSANVPFTVTLQQGQIYNVMGELLGGSPGTYTGVDLTGSRIRSISTGDIGCKRVAVFSGSGKMQIKCAGNRNSSDNLFAQAFPKSAWGKRFLTAPTQNMPNNYFRIAVAEPATVVKVNGVVQSGIINNFYYDLPLSNQPQLIEADQPIMVAQYITTANTCDNTFIGNNGDPDMIYLSPVEQTIDEVIVNSTPNAAISEHWINVVIKTNSVGSFKISGAAIPPSFTLHPQDPTYSYAQISVTSGAHTLSADSGFNAIAYGYGFAESYAYNAGTNLKDIYNFVEALNPLNITNETNTACACTPFFYTITYPFQPTSLFWDFKGFQTPNVNVPSPVADSTYFINGKQVWRYKLPLPYTYCPGGNYPVSITAGTPGTDGCGNLQTKDDTLFVKNIPLPEFNWQGNGCINTAINFNDISTYDPGVSSYIWSWDFGDGQTSTAHNPSHAYTIAGTYDVKFSLITNTGCISSIKTKQITVSNFPVANFNLSNLQCEGKPITFTNLSSIAGTGSIQKWYWDFGDGKKDSVFTNTPQIHSYLVWGNKQPSLQVVSNSGCTSNIFSKSFKVNPNPVADFDLQAVTCLPYDATEFNDLSTIADGTQAGFIWKWKFGEPSSGLFDSANTQNTSHLYSTVGPFSINLKVTSAVGCTDDTIKVLKNIYPKPTSEFTSNAENCLNDVTSFASKSNGQGSVITNWFWNFGDASLLGTGANTTHTYAAKGTYTIQHWITTDKGCNSDTSLQIITVNPLPTPNFNYSSPSCATKNISITDASLAGAGNIIKWIWNFGNGKPDSTINNNSSFNYFYNSVATYTVKLLLETDKGCKNVVPFTKNIIINPNPDAGFILPEVCLSDAFAPFIDTSKVTAGIINKWAWNFGDPASAPVNNSSTLQNPTHKYNAVGNYIVTSTVTSNNGCVNTIAQSFIVNGAIPVANFTPLNPAVLCANDSVSIKDGSTVDFGNITKVEIYWDNVNTSAVFETDDFPAPGKIYKHRYPNFQNPLTKIFSIRYRAYSGGTCVSDRIKTITVNAAPKVVFIAIPDICLDAAPYQIVQAVETGAVPGIGTFYGTGVSASGVFNPATAGVGVFGITYKFISAFGCTDSSIQTIKVLAPAIANFGFSKPACETKLVTFSDSSSVPANVGTITNWVWNFGDGTPAISNNTAVQVQHTFAAYGTYTITLSVTTSNGCKVSRQKQLIINPLPKPNFNFPAVICLPAPEVTFTNTSSVADGTENAFTYLWNFGDPSSGTKNTAVSKTPSHIYAALGPYMVNLKVTSGAGCIRDTNIIINTIHPQPVADFTSDSVSLCQGQSVQFKDNSTGADGTVLKWQWDFDNGQISAQKKPSLQTYTNANIYTITQQVENNFGCKDTASKKFTVYAYPVISAGPDRVLLQGGTIILNATASGNNLLFLWNPTAFLNSSSILTPVIKGLQEDTTFTLFVTAAGGCQSFDEVFVKVLKTPVIPNTFTPNSDGINDNWTIQYLDSYPECRVQVFNRYGQLIFESNGYSVKGWDGTYKGKSLPFGTYYYVIEPGSGRAPIKGYVTIIK